MLVHRLAALQAALLAVLASCVQAQLPPAPAPGPVLETGGDTVALAVQDGSCAGNGTFQGSGDFDGSGTFSAIESEITGNGTFSAESGYLAGAGVTCQANDSTVEIDDANSQIIGNGTVSGVGTFQTLNGTFNGNGTYSGQQITFTGAGTLAAPLGFLVGSGTIIGTQIFCTGPGSFEGNGSFIGTGSLTGDGAFDGNGDFTGTGTFVGVGECTGNVTALPSGSAVTTILPSSVAAAPQAGIPPLNYGREVTPGSYGTTTSMPLGSFSAPGSSGVGRRF
ncbi:hypothetical protein WJX74_000428 [Apatococcus lobatus]|uniref:Uncharacterized protein n=1 Tax=Apatococcus lobatus TaxID=904363 RepID=A0AAW1RIY0_9CHLO